MPWKTRRPRWLLTKNDVVEHRYLKVFGEHLHSPNLWHFNRRSVANATAVGLFCAFLPMPFEMVVAALGAIWFGGNLPLAVAWVWVSNPLTWLPLYTPAYLLGSWILNEPAVDTHHITMHVLLESMAALWLGCVIVGIVAGACGYFVVNTLWRINVRAHRAERARRYNLKKN